MAITYTWDFSSIKVKPVFDDLIDVIYSFEWKRTAKDGDFSASVTGIIVLPEPDIENFKSFEILTKTDLEGWAENFAYYPSFEPVIDRIAAIDKVLSDQIELMKNPPTVIKSAPWETE